MKEKRPTKRQMLHAAKNPFICPSCMQRFPSEAARDKHWDDNDVCDDYQLEGRLAVLALAKGNDRPYSEWHYNQPKKIFERGI